MFKTPDIKSLSRSTKLAWSEEHAILELGVISLSPTLGAEITKMNE